MVIFFIFFSANGFLSFVQNSRIKSFVFINLKINCAQCDDYIKKEYSTKTATQNYNCKLFFRTDMIYVFKYLAANWEDSGLVPTQVWIGYIPFSILFVNSWEQEDFGYAHYSMR